MTSPRAELNPDVNDADNLRERIDANYAQPKSR